MIERWSKLESSRTVSSIFFIEDFEETPTELYAVSDAEHLNSRYDCLCIHPIIEIAESDKLLIVCIYWYGTISMKIFHRDTLFLRNFCVAEISAIVTVFKHRLDNFIRIFLEILIFLYENHIMIYKYMFIRNEIICKKNINGNFHQILR